MVSMCHCDCEFAYGDGEYRTEHRQSLEIAAPMSDKEHPICIAGDKKAFLVNRNRLEVVVMFEHDVVLVFCWRDLSTAARKEGVTPPHEMVYTQFVCV